MSLGIVIRGTRAGQAPQVIGGFADRDEAEAFVSLAGIRHQVMRTGDERHRTGDLLAADFLDVKEAVKGQGPGFGKRLKDLVQDRVEDRAEAERRKAELLQQRADQKAAQRRQVAIDEAVERKRLDKEQAEILEWTRQASEELATAGAT